MILDVTGASPRPAGNPSPQGLEGGHRLFSHVLADALPKPAENPSLRRGEGGRRLDEYAAFYVQEMLKSMRETTFKSGLVDGGHAEEAFQAHLDLAYSNALACKLSFAKAFGKALDRLEGSSVTA